MPSYNWMHNDPKRYISPPYSVNPSYPVNTTVQNESNALFSIPLPNEREVTAEIAELPINNTPGLEEKADAAKNADQSVRAVKPKDGTKRIIPSVSGIFQYIQQHITLEDIILVALILLMLNESIDDDILLIILIYILLF